MPCTKSLSEPKGLQVFPSGYVEPLKFTVEEVTGVEGSFVLNPDDSRILVAGTIETGEVQTGDILHTSKGMEAVVDGISINAKSHYRGTKGQSVVLLLVGPAKSDMSAGDILREVED